MSLLWYQGYQGGQRRIVGYMKAMYRVGPCPLAAKPIKKSFSIELKDFFIAIYFTSWMMVKIIGRRLVRSKKYLPRASLTWVLMAFHSETLPASQRSRTDSMRSLASVRRASLSLT